MQHSKILVIDSGVGGLSIAQQIIKKCPSALLRYVADKAYYPYGKLSETVLAQRVCQLIRCALDDFSAEVIVIACNTASTSVLDYIRSIFSIPIVGVVPAIKPASKLTVTGHIAVLATQGTVNRPYTQNLIEQYASDHQVHLLACPHLVNLAENKLMGIPVCSEQISSALPNLIPQIDTVVLACTHFPLLKIELTAAFPDIKNWVDSGHAIANRVYSLTEDSHSVAAPHQLHVTQAQSPTNYDEIQLSQLLGNFEWVKVDT